MQVRLGAPSQRGKVGCRDPQSFPFSVRREGQYFVTVVPRGGGTHVGQLSPDYPLKRRDPTRTRSSTNLTNLNNHIGSAGPLGNHVH